MESVLITSLPATADRAGLRWKAQVHHAVRVAEFAIGGGAAGVGCCPARRC